MVGPPVPEENERRPREVIALLLNPRSQAPQLRKKIRNELKNQTGVEVSTKTIQRRLREKGIEWRKKSKKPYVSEKNWIARLKFAREHAGWSIEQWKRVVWSDESPFGCKNQSQQHVWRTQQETVVRRAMQGTVKRQKSINPPRKFDELFMNVHENCS